MHAWRDGVEYLDCEGIETTATCTVGLDRARKEKTIRHREQS